MTTLKYTPQKLNHHLSYEVSMLNGTYYLILNIYGMLDGKALDIIRNVSLNAAKEAFCLHARVLIEFFVEKRVNSATGFAQPSYIRPSPPKHFVKKLNNQLAHLMENRTDVDSEKIQGADRDDMFRWIDRELQRWRGSLDPAYAQIVIPNVDLTLIPLRTSTGQFASATDHVTAISSSYP